MYFSPKSILDRISYDGDKQITTRALYNVHWFTDIPLRVNSQVVNLGSSTVSIKRLASLATISPRKLSEECSHCTVY